MTRYYVEVTCLVHGVGDARLEEVFDDLVDAMHELSDVIDPDVGINMKARRLDFTMALDAQDEAEALQRALAAVRTAVHSANGSTPGWEKHFEAIQQVVRREAALAPA